MRFIISICLAIGLANPSIAQESSTKKGLSNVKKIYRLSLLWKEADYNFAHFDHIADLDWDETYRDFIPKVISSTSDIEYYNILKQFYALLNHHHTFVIPPQEMSNTIDEPQLKIVNIQRQAIVADVAVSLKEAIPVGSKIIQVDDVPVNDYLKNKFPFISHSTDAFLWEIGIIELLKGEKGTEVNIAYVTPTHETKEIALVRNSKDRHEQWVRSNNEKQRFSFKWLENGIAYMALNTFADPGIINDFKEKLPELYKSRGIIIDLRTNGGGNSDIGYEILKYFTDKPILTFSYKTRENRAVYKAWGRWTSELSDEDIKNISEERKEYLNHYNNTAFYKCNPDTVYPGTIKKIVVPFVVLTGNTGSAAEDFLVACDSIEKAVFVGKTTAGCTGTPYFFDLPGGGFATVTTTIQMYPDGRKQRNGIKPDIEVYPTIQDIIENKDSVLEKGIEILNDEIK